MAGYRVSLFEDAVVFLARSRSVDNLAEGLGVESAEAVQVGVVLSVPIVIAGLAGWVEQPVGAYWLTARLTDLGFSEVDDFDALIGNHDVGFIGEGVLERIVGDRWDSISERIARRAGLPASSAERILTISATTVLARLAGRHRGEMDRQVLVDELAAERQELLDGGWESWITETLESVRIGTESPSAHTAVVYAAPLSASAGVAADEPDLDPGLSSNIEASPDPSTLPVAGSVLVSPGHDEKSGRPGGRDWLRPIGLFMLGLAGTVVVLFFVARSGDGDSSEPTQAVTSLVPDETPGTAQAEGSTTSSAGEQVASGVAIDDVIVVEQVMDDPLGRTAGTGTADLRFDPVTGEVCYEFEVDGVGSPYDGHIHVGPAGVKGGIVVDFGELNESSAGCIANSPVDTDAILVDLGGHYVEFHDPDDVTTIRAQLAEPDPAGPTADDDEVDRDSEGAVIVIETGAMVLTGNVPDQVTMDKLIETFADIDLGSTRLVNNLQIVPGSPRPSGRIVVDDAVLFEFDSDQLTDPESTVLTDLATLFNARPAWSMTVVGHTDSTGTTVYNLELSLRRASAVRAALLAAGVSADALTIRGSGDTDPIATNGTIEGRAQNRRIEFEVVAA